MYRNTVVMEMSYISVAYPVYIYIIHPVSTHIRPNNSYTSWFPRLEPLDLHPILGHFAFWVRSLTCLESILFIFSAFEGKIQGICFGKNVFGYNFWMECPTDLRTTSLSCIFYAFLGDTPLDHIFSVAWRSRSDVSESLSQSELADLTDVTLVSDDTFRRLMKWWWWWW